jgi:serine/threonine protein kinase
MVNCPNCQTLNQATSKFCLRCGTQLTPSPSPGKTLLFNTLLNNRYQIDKKLAEGGMGAVYLAKDMQLFGRECVVKEMLPYYTTSAEKTEAEQKFQREAELLANLNHPGIPQVHDYFIDQSHYYLVMQFVAGEDLEVRLTKMGGMLPEAEIVNYARQLISVLAYISQQKPPIIHRDIKPANIILESATGQVKLVDFGIAKAQVATTSKTTPMGTLGYAPPEQYRGQTEPRTDVFALGATLHHLLTGRDPRHEAPFDFPPVNTLLPTISAEFNAVVEQMLTRDVAQRPSAIQLKSTLENLGQTRGTGSTPFALRSGSLAHTPQELAAVCDQNWSDGVFHLYQGHFEAWFQSQNRHDLANRATKIRQASGDRNKGLEEFIQALTPTMSLPVLSLDTAVLDYGAIEKGDTPLQELNLVNTGRGYLHGTIQPLVDWVSVNETGVKCTAGATQKIHVTLNSSRLNEGSLQEPSLEIKTNGGHACVDVHSFVTWQPKLTLQPSKIDFGEVLVEEHGKVVQTTITVSNSGGGLLNGHLVPPASWLTSTPDQFNLTNGQASTITLTADTSQIPALQMQTVPLAIQSGHTTTQVPVYIGIKKSWYDSGPRAARWLAYGSLMLGAVMAWAYALGFVARHLLTAELPAELALLAWPVGALLLPFVLFKLGQRFEPELDEIENYYHQRDLLADTSATILDANRSLIILTLLVVTGLIVGSSSVFIQTGSYIGWHLLLGGAGGLLMGSSLVYPQLGWLRLLCAGLSFSVLGLLLIPVNSNTLFLWATAGIVTAALFEPFGQVRRVRWALANTARPGLVLIVAVAGVLVAQAVFSRYLISPWFYYRQYNPSGVSGAFQALVMTFGALAGAWLGYWAGLTNQDDWRVALHSNRRFLILLAVTTTFIFIPFRGLFYLAGTGDKALLISLALLIMGGLTYGALYQTQRVESWLDQGAGWLAKQLTPLLKIGWLNGRLNFLTTLSFHNAFANLNLAFALSAIAALIVALPFLIRLVWGILGLLILVAIVAGLIAFAVYIIRQNIK